MKLEGCHYAHFTDEHTETQGAQVLNLKNLNSGSLESLVFPEHCTPGGHPLQCSGRALSLLKLLGICKMLTAAAANVGEKKKKKVPMASHSLKCHLHSQCPLHYQLLNLQELFSSFSSRTAPP